MPTVKCPHCHNSLEFSVGPADNPTLVQPQKYDSLISDVDGQIADRELRAVLAFLRTTGAGIYSSRLLHSKYSLWRQEQGAPGLSPGGFGRALALCGATQHRTAKERGWIIPENIDTLEPLKPYLDSRRAQRATMKQAIADYTGNDGPADAPNVQVRPAAEPPNRFADLPFEIELPD